MCLTSFRIMKVYRSRDLMSMSSLRAMYELFVCSFQINNLEINIFDYCLPGLLYFEGQCRIKYL